MAISLALLAKGFVGTIAIASSVCVGIYYKDEIFGTSKSISDSTSKNLLKVKGSVTSDQYDNSSSFYKWYGLGKFKTK